MIRPPTRPLVPLTVLPERSAPAPDAGSHFAAIGGESVIARLVERFYHHMDSIPEAAVIRAMHPSDLTEVKAVLTRYLVEWMGGPSDYSAERGHPRLRRRHQPFAIGQDERDAWLRCMTLALHDVVADAALREALGRAFARVAEAVQNRASTSDERSKA